MGYAGRGQSKMTTGGFRREVKEDGGWGGMEGKEEVMERAQESARGRGEGRVSLDTVLSSADVLAALLTISLDC